MKKTAIFSMSPSCTDILELNNAYYIVKLIVKETLIKSNCKAKTRISLGNYKFKNRNDIVLQTTPLIHIIITGKDITKFIKLFSEKIESYSGFTITSEYKSKGNAFKSANNKLIRRISIKDVICKSNGKTPNHIKEISETNYVLTTRFSDLYKE